MKKLFLSALLITFGLISFSQAPPDDDNDGIPNSEDLCPKTKGTKANKGCPENATEKAGSTSFLTNKEFETIMDAVCYRNQSSLINTGIPIEADGTQQTTLPFTGPKKEFPVYYNENKNQIYTSTIIILSENGNDLEPAFNEIVNKAQNIQTLCLTGKKPEINSTSNNDEKSVLFRDMLGNGEFEMRIYKHKTDNQTFIVWNIFSIDPEKEKIAVVQKAKSQGIFDKKFSDDVKKILTASSNGFIKNRFEGKKNELTDELEFKTDLPLLGLQKAIISTTSVYNLDDEDDEAKITEYRSETHYNIAATNIETIVTELERKCDGSLDFEKKDIIKDKNMILYTIKGNSNKQVTLHLFVSESVYIISLSVTDKSVEFKN
ncbi:hypothetical protein [Ferruginibacter sp.]|nr:hypothetical protein [Ferruginibacter sp.]